MTITVRDRVGAETVDRFVVNVGLVQAQPSLALTAPSTAAVGEPLTATAALTGGTNPTGTINFRVHGPSDPTCTQDPVFSAPRTVTGNGSYTTPPFTPTASGAHRWVATYGGDANNQQAATACGAAGTTTVVQAPIAQADLFMSKSCLPSAVHAGEAVVCTVRVTNDGPAAAADVVLVDDVPGGLAITTAPTSDGLTCAVQGIDPEIRCTTATVADGGDGCGVLRADRSQRCRCGDRVCEFGEGVGGDGGSGSRQQRAFGRGVRGRRADARVGGQLR